MRAPACGIVVPVCNEAAILPLTVPRLVASAQEVGGRLVWVCNGCTDGSADLVRRLAGAGGEVTEIAERAKTRALQAGDDRLGALFPRFYIDADTWLPPGGLTRLLSPLRAGEADLVAPGHAFDCTGASAVSLRIARCWLALPHARMTAFVGVIGLSAAGRARWGRWPAVTGDDIFAAAMIPAGRRRLLPEVSATTRPPPDFAGWVRMRSRWLKGERELRGRGLRIPASPGQRRALLVRLLRGPDPAGAWAFLAARMLASWNARGRTSAGWIPDRRRGGEASASSPVQEAALPGATTAGAGPAAWRDRPSGGLPRA